MTVDAAEDTQLPTAHCGDVGDANINLLSSELSHHSSPPLHSDPSASPYPESDREDMPAEDRWFPFLSKPHMQLCLLYHGSHRKNMDQVSLRAIMDILKVSDMVITCQYHHLKTFRSMFLVKFIFLLLRKLLTSDLVIGRRNFSISALLVKGF